MSDGALRAIVLGLFLHDDRLLVFRGYDAVKGSAYYRPLGGGIDFGERGEQALRRELREEVAAEITDIRYLGLIENLFTVNGRAGHEIILLYTARFIDPSIYGRQRWQGDENGAALEVLWKPLAEFSDQERLVPAELWGYLPLLTSSPARPGEEPAARIHEETDGFAP